MKLDVKQFFASVDHEILLKLIAKKVKDKDIIWLINEILSSFRTDEDREAGIPLGNLTSQIFANIYLNELDQFIKHKLRIKYYIRYADDFLTLNTEKQALKTSLISIGSFLQIDLKLQIHPKKIILRKLNQGIDFCGYIVLPNYILPRTKTKRRIVNNASSKQMANKSFQSCIGYLSHAESYRTVQNIKNIYFLKSRSKF